MLASGGAQVTHPQVGVLFPGEVFFDPTVEPTFAHGIYHVAGVRIDVHLMAGGLQFFQRDDHRQEFHPVVGRQAESLLEGLFVVRAVYPHHDAVAAGTGVAPRGAVGVDVYLHTSFSRSISSLQRAKALSIRFFTVASSGTSCPVHSKMKATL